MRGRWKLSKRARGRWLLIAALKDDDEVRVAPFDAVPFGLAVLWAD